MTHTLTAVVAPLAEEAAALRGRLEDATRVRLGEPRNLRSLQVGRLGRESVAVAVTGDGERNARAGMHCLLEVMPVRRVIVIGVAGGLDPQLGPGALVVAREVRSEQATLRAGAHLADLAARATGAQAGMVLTARDLLVSPDAKAAFRTRWAARADLGEASVVDLESAYYAEAAQDANIPWIVLRAVSDTAADALPALLNRCRDEHGAIMRGAIARRMLMEASAIPSLLRLRRRVAQCSAVLAEAVERVVAEWSEDD
jgi:adenosylhomocysteine nucleosidase